MEGKLKFIILVLVILLAISLFVVFNIQNSKLALFREYNESKERLTQENEKFAKELKRTLTDNQSLQERIGVMQRDLERISSERDQLERSFRLVSKERMALLERIKSYGQLGKDLESFKKENKILKEKVNALGEDKLKLETDLDEFRQDNESLKQELKQAKLSLKEKALPRYVGKQEVDLREEYGVRSVDLPPIIVSSEASLGITPFSSLEGKILNVNREYNFVVINLGQHMGVKQGMVFEVFREYELLGKIEVVQVREEITACDIIQVDTPFETGDIVRY